MTNRVIPCGLLAVLLMGAGGCSRPAGFEKYIPATERARGALESALSAWKSGEAVVSVVDGVKVELDDSTWRNGRQLNDFEILGEVSGDDGRWFEVRLVLTAPPEIRQTRYTIIGIDPLWVIRQEDYAAMAHWEHPMEAPQSTPPQTANR